jgi:WD40 repeat protein/mono/diheme cytochrome c family protein
MRWFVLALAFAAPVTAADPPAVSYHKEIVPIFRQNCVGCHQPARAQGGYIMTDYASTLKPGEQGKPGVVPGKPESSYVLSEIRLVNGKHEMPKNRDALTPDQFAKIELWIKQGAKDDTPPAAKATPIDAEHPPVYAAAPVVTSVAFSKDGQLLAVSGFHEVLLHKADGSGLAGRLVGLAERIQTIAFSPDGKKLAAAAGSPGRFGELQIWDVAKQRLLTSTPVTFDTIYGVAWSPDGSKVAVGCADNTVRAYDATNGKQILFMGTHGDWVLGTCFSRDGQHLVSVSRDMTVKLTEVATQRFIDNVTSITPGALKGGLMAVDVRPVVAKQKTLVPLDSGGGEEKPYDELIVAGADGIPRLYKMHRETKRVIGDDANKIRGYDALPGRISGLKFDSTGKRFAAASSLDGNGEVRVYDTDAGKMLVKFEGITGPVYTVAWSPDGKTVASSGYDGIVWLHAADTGKPVKSFSAAPLKVAAK